MLVLAGCSGADSAELDSEEWPGPTSREESDQIFMDCLAEMGWEVEQMPDGGFTPGEIPPEQGDAYSEATAECSPLALPRPENFTQDEWQEWYESLMETTRCLEEEGYSFPDKPTVQQFIDGQGEWSPYGDLWDSGTVTGIGETELLYEICPEQEFWPSPR